MSSTNKLYSRLRTYIAKFLLSFCGIASFGVVGMAVVIGCALFSFSFFSSSASAVGENGSNTVGANISSSIAIRLLDSTASTDITRLDFNLTPTAPGTSFNPSISQGTERTVVDVATSNPTGYKLYMQSNYLDSSSNYTTDLVHTTNGTPDVDIADTIPTSTSASTLYWNYTNPMTSSATVIPAYGNPDKLDQYYDATNSRQTPVDINVSVDTTIVSGTYQNQLLFSAVGNPEPVSYTVSFDGNGGSPVPSTITGSATSSTFSTAIDSTIPVKTGYTFSHWEITSVSSTSPTPDINPTATCNSTNTCNPGDSLDISTYGEPGVVVALTAVYTINTHTVTITNGTGIDSTTITCSNSTNNTTNTCTYGDTVTISATPATGYSFSSWTTSDVTIENNQFTMPDSNVDITANAEKMYSYTFQWEANAGSESVSGLPNLQNYPRQTLSSYTITIPSGTPTRAGYTFTGYNTKPDGSGTTYQPGNTITGYSSSASSTPTADGYPVTTTLYAIWEQAYDGLMQDKAMISQCNKSAVGTTLNLLDTRDNKVYQVRKLADGKCWMTQNLNYLPAAGTTLTNDNTNVSSPVTLNSITTDCSDANIDNFCIVSAGKDDLDYGTYYNWYAATASSGTSSMVAPDVAPYSICPKGWRLPTGGSSGEYQTLYNNYNSWTAMTNPSGPHFVRGGYHEGTSTNLQGTFGYYWSSSATTGAIAAYDLFLNGSTSAVYPAVSYNKRAGFPVRCVAEATDITEITTMQEMTSNICENTEKGTQKTLTDARDNNIYTVRKLADGKCWMVQNLRFSQTGTLSSDTSNVSSSNTFGLGSSSTAFGSSCSNTSKWMSAGSDTYGNFYNWYAATAGSGTCSTSSGNASYSICPKGWRLPTSGGTSGDFAKLDIAWGGTGANRSSANTYGNFTGTTADASHAGFVLAGNRSGSSTNFQSSRGFYWSSTAHNASSAYNLSLFSSNSYVGPSPDNYKYLGFSVRCVAQ